jgi:hypothetical protein
VRLKVAFAYLFFLSTEICGRLAPGRTAMDKIDKPNDTTRRNFLKGIAAMPAIALTGGKNFGAEAAHDHFQCFGKLFTGRLQR